MMTLEEAMREVHFVRLDELREKHGSHADVQVSVTEDGWWVFLNDDGKWNNIKEFGIGEWEAAFSYALGRKVVARNDAAELRARIQNIIHVLEKKPIHWLHSPDALVQTVNELRAALAATEGSE